MKSVKFYDSTNTVKLVPESFEDLYLLAMVVSKDNYVSSKSYRRFKASETDKGEQKEVFVRLVVEKTELDRGAGRLRIIGKIVSGHPEEYIQVNSYHTLTVGPLDEIEIEKPEGWGDFIIRRIRQAVLDSKRPRLGVIAVDDEKATLAYIRGYGIDLSGELFSHLSKRMKEKDFEAQREKYFKDIIDSVKRMDVELVIIAGPGFTKDDIRKYVEYKGIETGKRLVYVPVGDAERSGIREAVRSHEVSKMLETEHVRREFELLDALFRGMRSGSALLGVEKIREHLNDYKIEMILVNDSKLNTEEIKKILNDADRHGVAIEIFNSEDEAGKQLESFGGIAGMYK